MRIPLAVMGILLLIGQSATPAAMVELVDTRDLKSLGQEWPCGFESRSRHFLLPPPMRHFPYILFMAMLCVACGVDSGHFKLSGRFLNMNQGEFYIYSPDGKIDGIDTIKVVGGRFTFERPCERPALMMLVFPNFSEQPIFAEPGKSVDIKADASHMKEMEVKGTKANEQMTAFRRQAASASPPEIIKMAEEFINEHPDSPVGMYLLRKYFVQGITPDYKRAAILAEKMLEKQPKNGELIILARQLEQLKNGMVGTKAPRFSGSRLGGGSVTEADLGDDIAVVSTWSSWSYESMEMQRQLRRKAKASGGRIRLVGICLDADKKACERVVERDTLDTYPIIFDGQLFECPAMKQMGLSTVPDNVVYHHGKVVAKGLNLNELKQKLDEL